MKTVLPSVILVGAAKSGSTSVMEFLEKDLGFYVQADKETKYFSLMPSYTSSDLATQYQNKRPKSEAEYIEIYQGVEAPIAENSNDYLYFYSVSIEEIKRVYDKYNCEYPKIIVLIRNPVNRVLSLYYHHMRLGSATESFDEMWKESSNCNLHGRAWPHDLKGNFQIAQAVGEYKKSFKNVFVTSLDNLTNDEGLKSLCMFLGLKFSPGMLLKQKNANSYDHYRSGKIKDFIFFILKLYLGLKNFIGINYNLGIFNHIIRIIPKSKNIDDYTRCEVYAEMQYLSQLEKQKFIELGYSSFVENWDD